MVWLWQNNSVSLTHISLSQEFWHSISSEKTFLFISNAGIINLCKRDSNITRLQHISQYSYCITFKWLLENVWDNSCKGVLQSVSIMRWLKFTNNSVSHRWSFLCLSTNRVRFDWRGPRLERGGSRLGLGGSRLGLALVKSKLWFQRLNASMRQSDQ